MTFQEQKTENCLQVYGVPDLNFCRLGTGQELVLSPPAARAVATGMFLLYSWYFPLKRLVPLTAEAIAKLRQSMAEGWDLTSPQEALQRMDDLYEVGHRARLQPQLVQNEAYWRGEFDRHALLRDHPVTSVAAWDYGRIAALAYWSLMAGYLDSSTAFQYMDKATRASLERFNSWQEFAVSYLAGRLMWNPEDPEGMRNFIGMAQRHLTSQVRCWASSPWATYTPWPWPGLGHLV